MANHAYRFRSYESEPHGRTIAETIAGIEPFDQRGVSEDAHKTATNVAEALGRLLELMLDRELLSIPDVERVVGRTFRNLYKIQIPRGE
jgi:hypothetical protein